MWPWLAVIGRACVRDDAARAVKSSRLEQLWINEKRKHTGLHHKTVKAGRESEEAYNLLLMGLAFLSLSFYMFLLSPA